MIPNDFLPIANHLWQSTLFAGVAAVLTLLLKNNRAHARYCLWLAASVKFLVPFSLLMVIGGMAGRNSVITAVPARLPIIVEQVNEPFAAEFPPARVAIPQASKPGIRIVPILAALWAIGCGAFVFSWCMRWRRMRLVVRSGSPVPLAIDVPVLSSPPSLSLEYSGHFVRCCCYPTELLRALRRWNSRQFSPTNCVMSAAATICRR